ncbi:MAG: formylglycine-generating enzyme family protein, partial [Verrucomicrobiota bacterium]
LPNAWGLYDMMGSVLEWCSDFYGGYLTEAVTDPELTIGSFRVVRGGSWFHGAGGARSAFRLRGDPGKRYSTQGFRPALSSVR